MPITKLQTEGGSSVRRSHIYTPLRQDDTDSTTALVSSSAFNTPSKASSTSPQYTAMPVGRPASFGQSAGYRPSVIDPSYQTSHLGKPAAPVGQKIVNGRPTIELNACCDDERVPTSMAGSSRSQSITPSPVLPDGTDMRAVNRYAINDLSTRLVAPTSQLQQQPQQHQPQQQQHQPPQQQQQQQSSPQQHPNAKHGRKRQSQSQPSHRRRSSSLEQRLQQPHFLQPQQQQFFEQQQLRLKQQPQQQPVDEIKLKNGISTSDGKESDRNASEESDLPEYSDLEDEEEEGTVSSDFREFVKSTTLHGVGQAAADNSAWQSRLFWTVTMVVVFCMVFVQLNKLVFYFVANPTVTSIDVIYPKEGLELPSITLCSLAKLNKTLVNTRYPKITKHVAEFSMTSFMSAYRLSECTRVCASPISTALMDLTYFNSSTNYTIEQLEEQLWENSGHADIRNFVYDTTFTCENQFKMCWFENGHLFDCCAPNEFITVKRHLTHSGACFEFTPNKNTSRQRLPGPVGGFGFMYWYPNEHIYKTAYNSYNEHAVQLYMSAVDSMLENNPISLPIGYHSHLNLQATLNERQTNDELGRSTCRTDHLKYFDEYSYQSCQVECLIDTMIKACNCTGIHDYARLPQDRVCSPLDAVKCYQKLALKFTDLLVECREERCGEACNYWSYGASLTVASVFHPCCKEEMAAYWHTPAGKPEESLIIADVYFGDIKYTKVTQKPALTIETFVSSIGGAMGLWTGASIITWIHLLYFCCARCCKSKTKRLADQKRLKAKRAAKRNMKKTTTRSRRRRPPDYTSSCPPVMDKILAPESYVPRPQHPDARCRLRVIGVDSRLDDPRLSLTKAHLDGEKYQGDDEKHPRDMMNGGRMPFVAGQQPSVIAGRRSGQGTPVPPPTDPARPGSAGVSAAYLKRYASNV